MCCFCLRKKLMCCGEVGVPPAGVDRTVSYKHTTRNDFIKVDNFFVMVDNFSADKYRRLLAHEHERVRRVPRPTQR